MLATDGGIEVVGEAENGEVPRHRKELLT